jgi:hypothetical protein
MKKIKSLLAIITAFSLSLCQLLYGQSQSFSGGYWPSVMVTQKGEVYHSGRINGVNVLNFTKVPQGQQVQSPNTGYLNKIAQVHGGSGGHILALACDGYVYAWGENAIGQFGNNTTTGSSTPMRVLKGAQSPNVNGTYLENVKYISGGDLSSYALLLDGTVMAWGENANGRLGDGTTTDRLTPVYVKINAATVLTNCIQVYGGEEFAIALRSDGTVWVWGSNLHECSNGLASSYAHQVFFANGSPLNNIVRVAGGDTHTLALDASGHLWSWGGNWENQLGDGLCCDDPYPKRVIGIGQTAPTTTYLDNVVNFDAGAFMSLAVLSDGRAVGWGSNRQNSNGTGAATLAPAYIKDPTGTVPITGIVDVSTGDSHGFAVDLNGQLYSWGKNDAGQLSLGDLVNRNYPQPIAMPPSPVLTPCPIARLGPDVVLCNPITASLYAGCANIKFTYKWYKDGILLPSDTTAYLVVNSVGTYKVVIEDTSSVTTCTPCLISEDETVISTNSVSPLNAFFCTTPKVVSLGVNSGLSTFDWYAAATGGVALTTGSNTFSTPPISTTTTYYVQDTRTFNYSTGYQMGTPPGTSTEGLSAWTSVWNNSAFGYMNFTVSKTLTLVSVKVYSDQSSSCTGSAVRTINLRNMGTNTIVQSANASVVCVGSQVFPLGFTIAPGNYRLEWTAGFNVMYYDAGASYQFGVPGLISLTGTNKTGNVSSSTFFDWVISAPTNCARVPVKATLTTNCSLPFDLLYFNGTKINQSTHLTWQTTREENSRKFEVERSMDGINFTKIGEINSSGSSNSNSTYQFIDNETSELSGEIYYRLKQIDNDLSYAYSEIVVVNYENNGESICLFPNPIKKGENLYLSLSDNSVVQIKIFDLTGKELVDNDIKNFTKDLIINTANIPYGIYLIQLKQRGSSPQVIKLIVN